MPVNSASKATPQIHSCPEKRIRWQIRAVKCLTGIDAVHITRVADVAVDFLVTEINLWIVANGLTICRHSPARERGSIANNRSGKRTEGDPEKQSQSHAANQRGSRALN